LDNLTLIAIIIMVLWLGAIGYYFYTSRQQNAISHEIDDLKEMLGEDSKQSES